MIKYFCDRCKKDCTDDRIHLRTIEVPDVFDTSHTIVYNGNRNVLLCDQCAHDYNLFLRCVNNPNTLNALSMNSMD